MVEDKTWLIKLENNGIEAITVCKNGYVFDSKKRKLFILKKLAMETLTDLINEYETANDSENHSFNCIIKCNGNNKFISYNYDFFNKIISMIYKSDNIKHPPELFDEMISLVNNLRISGELNSMIKEYGQDTVVSMLFNM